MRQFGTFSKHIMCQFSWWHGTFFTLFIAFISYVAWAVSFCQEASFGWLGRVAESECGGKLALPRPPVMPRKMLMVCWQQPAGGDLGSAICSPPRKLRVYEREWENVLFYIHGSLTRPVSNTKTTVLPDPPLGVLLQDDHESTALKMTCKSVGRVLFMCTLQEDTLSTCISVLSSEITSMWHKQGRGEWVGRENGDWLVG